MQRISYRHHRFHPDIIQQVIGIGLVIVSKAKFLFQRMHARGIDENEYHKDENGTLLGEPEAQLEAKELKSIQGVDERDFRMSALGRLRPLAIVSAQRPLSGAYRPFHNNFSRTKI